MTCVPVFVKENTHTFLAGRIKPGFDCVGDVVLAVSSRPVFQGRALYLTRMSDDEQLGENVALSTLPQQTGPTGVDVTLRVHTCETHFVQLLNTFLIAYQALMIFFGAGPAAGAAGGGAAGGGE